MKKHASIGVLLFVSAAAFATIYSNFPGSDELAEHSPEIVIARCSSTLDFISTSNKVTVPGDGVIRSDIEILSVLKGNTKTGPAQLRSQYWPYRGEYFLLFSNDENDQFYKGFSAFERYRVVSLGHFLKPTSWLAGH